MPVERRRDIVVIGASLGGVEALRSLVGQLPFDFPATVLIVQHTSEQSPGFLPEILDAAGPLPAFTAEDGSALDHGRIYVAPTDRHLLLTGEGMRVVFGPRENRSRPAIDPLFRTAAVHYRSRVVGVVLTGLLADGAAGLLAVHLCGGAAVVQSPEDAACPDMPRNALLAVPEARRVALGGMGELLTALLREGPDEPPPVPEGLRIEALLTERGMSSTDWSGVPTRATDFTCPECSGALREIDGEPVRRFRCRVGHAYSADNLLAAKGDGVEDALWVAMQTLQERSQMLERLAGSDRERGWLRNAEGYDQRARESRLAAERLGELLRSLTP